MPKKSTKKTKKVEVESQEEQVLEEQVQEVPQAPQVEVLPEGVLRKEVVDINGRKYMKFWREDGTSDVELLE